MPRIPKTASCAGQYPDVHVDSSLDDEGDLKLRVGTQSTYLDAAGRSALVKAINEAEGKCPKAEPIAPPAGALEALLNFAGEHGYTVTFRYDKKSGRGNIEERHLIPSEAGVTKTLGGAKIIVGHDPDRDDVRAYRLDRIIAGSVSLR